MLKRQKTNYLKVNFKILSNNKANSNNIFMMTSLSAPFKIKNGFQKV